MKLTVLAILIWICSMTVFETLAQTSNQEKPNIYQLSKEEEQIAFQKPPRECRQQAKKLYKDGYKEVPGDAILDRQQYYVNILRIKKTNDGKPRFIISSYRADTEDFIAARKFAEHSVKMSLAGYISTTVVDIIKTSVDVNNLSKSELNSLSKMASQSKSLIAQEVNNLLIPFVAAKELDNGFSVWVTAAVDREELYSIAKKVMKNEMLKENLKMEKEVDSAFEIIKNQKLSGSEIE
jgi:hypothetical protein